VEVLRAAARFEGFEDAAEAEVGRAARGGREAGVLGLGGSNVSDGEGFDGGVRPGGNK
jgi:hypothetical protein